VNAQLVVLVSSEATSEVAQPVLYDLAGLRAKLSDEHRRLATLEQGGAEWEPVTDGRASGLALAASLLDGFRVEPGRAARG